MNNTAEDFKSINLKDPGRSLFDKDAERFAGSFSGQGDKNKSTQIRRFYDEMTRFSYRLKNADEAAFKAALPFIKMINARVAYAKERKLVDDNFQRFMRTCLDQVEDKQTLRMFCTLFEAIIGFSPKK